MKRYLALVFCSTLLTVGCSSNYEQAIVDFVKTDSGSKFADSQFELISIDEPGNITVADSIFILTKKQKFSNQQTLVTLNQDINLVKRILLTLKPRGLRERMAAKLVADSSARDSLMALTYEVPQIYCDVDTSRVLAKRVLCRFVVDDSKKPGHRLEQERVFIFDPQGVKCLRMFDQ